MDDSAYVEALSEPIAIIGSGCRFSGNVTSPSKLWELLKHPTDLSRDAPLSRWSAEGFYHPDGEHHGTTDAPKGYWLEQDHRAFDASFFNIPPKEAEAIDPQQKILLETVYEGMESAGLTMNGCSGEQIGVFVGSMSADYLSMTLEDKATMSQYTATGTAKSILSNRVSYFFNWTGPSMTIDTACSSSLVALHQAVLGLRSGEIPIACAAGVNIMLTPEYFIAESSLHMLSPTGTSKMWDAGADGYARGEGFGVLFLKTLSRALADGDDIECIVRETGINSDGRSKGITMPSAKAQASLIQDVYARSGLDPRDPLHRCQYFEAHGTGTQAGDPREAEAIHLAFFGAIGDDVKQENDNNKRLLVGSIKTIIGHTEGAAGIAGLMKTSLAMKHGIVPANQHMHTLNPNVSPFMGKLEVPAHSTAWPQPPPGQPLRGSVNSFGFGGTNAHAILEKYEPTVHNGNRVRPVSPPAPPDFKDASAYSCASLRFSAHNEPALLHLVKNYVALLQENTDISLPDLASTLSFRRSDMAYKIAFTGITREDLIEKMTAAINKAEEDKVAVGVRSKAVDAKYQILGIFTGQGAQWATMGTGLLSASPIFKSSITALDGVLCACPRPPSWSIESELQASATTSRLHEAALSQPICTAVQIALVDLLKASGVQFKAVVGHSSGEIGAAYAAGALSARDAILVAYYRGTHARLASGPGDVKGSMLAAGLAAEEAIDLCEQAQFRGRLFVAAINSPASVTLSGDIRAIEDAKEMLDGYKKFARALKVDTAYHSHHMDNCAAPYLASLNATGICVNPMDSSCVWVSSVYGPVGSPSSAELSGSYWRDNMVQPVLFAEALTRVLMEQGPFNVAVEVGPHAALKGPATQTMQDVITNPLPYTGVLNRGTGDCIAFADAINFLWVNGGSAVVDIARYAEAMGAPEAFAQAVVKGLPAYPWDHKQTHLREMRLVSQYLHPSATPHELLGMRTPDSTDMCMRWRNILKPTTIPWLKHHRFQGQIIVPAAAYCVMALDAARIMAAARTLTMVELQDINIHNGITMPDDSPGVEVLFTMTSQSPENSPQILADFLLEFASVEGGDRRMRKAASGRILLDLQRDLASDNFNHPGTNLPEGLSAVDTDEFYSSIKDTGLAYTGPFRAMASMKRRLGFATARLDKPHAEDPGTLSVRPTMLDSSLQLAFVAFAAPHDGALWTSFLPQSFRRIRFFLPLCEVHVDRPSEVEVSSFVTQFLSATHTTQASFLADVEIMNSSGDIEIQVEGLSFYAAPSMEADDRELYFETIFKPDAGSLVPCMVSQLPAARDEAFETDCEQVAAHYSDMQRVAGAGDLERVVNVSPYRSALEMLNSFGKHDLGTLIPGLVRHLRQESYEAAAINHQIGRIIEPICHRYPRVNVLELDSGSGLSTSSILQALGSCYTTYTYVHSAETLPPHLMNKPTRNFSTQPYQSDKPLAEQLSTCPSYDIVVLSHVNDENAASAQAQLSDIHEVMTRGGYLIVIDLAPNLLRERLIACLKGKQPSYKQDRSPTRSNQLVDSGFSEALSTYHTPDQNHSLLLTQALDSFFNTLLHPLHADLASFASMSGNILIVGGKRPETRSIASSLIDALKNWNGVVITADSFEDIKTADTRHLRGAVILADLDEPVVGNMSKETMDGLSELFMPQRFALWVTSGYQADNPHHYASMGMCRTLKQEVPQFTLQFLDVTSPWESIDTVCEAFIRLAMAECLDTTQYLWTVEHELVDAHGQLHIPRVLPAKSRNHRLNSIRRVIHEDVDTAQVNTQLALSGISAHTVDAVIDTNQSQPQLASGLRHKGLEYVQLAHTSLLASPVGTHGHLFIGIGKTRDQKRILTALPSSSSCSDVPRSWTYVLPSSSCAIDDTTLVGMVHRYLTAQHVLELCSTTPLLIHEAGEAFIAIMRDLINRCPSFDGRIFFSTAESANRDPSIILLREHYTRRANRAALAHDIRSVVDFSSSPTSESELRDLVGVSAELWSTLLRPVSTIGTSSDPDGIGTILESAYSAVSNSPSLSLLSDQQDVKPVRYVIDTTSNLSPFTVVDWSTNARVPSRICTIDPATLFSPEKTYLLVGLTGDLGKSLCRFMVEHGSRHIICVSRNPEQTTAWKADLEAAGAHIAFVSADATKISDIHRLRSDALQKHPPIAGIINGAMVLADGIFADLDIQDFRKVLRPKIDGSKNLDEVFAEDDLDFFVMFSSLTGVVGNRGQSHYAAANMYMAGLAENRRKRGLAGSAIDIGVLYGIGYVNRTGGKEIYQNLRRQGYHPESERDVHHMLTEAIIAGKPDSGSAAQITTGLSRFSIFGNAPLPWHSEPRFSHLTLEASNDVATADANISTTQSLAEKLQGCESETDATAVLKQCFASQLGAILHHQADDQIDPAIPIIDLGVDSLVAVSVRSWFLKEVDKDVSVLKILSGASVAEVVEEIAPELFKQRKSTPAPLVDGPLGSSSEVDSSDSASRQSGTESDASTPPTSEEEDPISAEDLEVDMYEKVAPMSVGQSRIWLSHILLENNTAYNCTTTYRIHGLLDVPRLEKAIKRTMHRHEPYRTGYFTDPATGESMQAVLSYTRFKLQHILEANTSDDIDEAKRHSAKHNYDLEHGDVFLATVLTHTSDSHTVVFGYHHIMNDAVSWQVFLQDVDIYYGDLTKRLPPATQFSEFAVKQQRIMDTKPMLEKRNYWRKEFIDLPETLPLLPLAKTQMRKSLQIYSVRERFVELDRELAAKIRTVSAANKVTPFHFYFATLQVLLYRWLGTEDICIGMTDANRTDPAFVDTVGFILEALPLRLKMKGDEKFTARLVKTRDTVFGALDNSGVPFDQILNDVGAEAAPTHPPLFQILINYRVGANQQKSFGDVDFEYLSYDDAQHPYDFIVSIDEDGPRAAVTLSMQEYMFDQTGYDLFVDTYIHLLDQLTSRPSSTLDECSLVSAESIVVSTELARGPDLTLDWPPTLPQRIDDMSRQHPDHIALRSHAASLTYREMDDRVDEIARHLQSAGTRAGTRVVMFCEQSTCDAITSLLAILRVGAIYIPLDSRNSNERLNSIVRESKPSVLMCDASTHPRAEQVAEGHDPIEFLNVARISNQGSVGRVKDQSKPSSLFSIMFTSGTTGKPKGIELTHANFLTHIAAVTVALNLKQENILQQSGLAYDASLAQIFYALANGGTVALSSNRSEMREVAEVMQRQKVSLTLMAPSEYFALFQHSEGLLASCDAWRIALCGGEAFPPALRLSFRAMGLPSVKLYNEYGPTEVSVASSTYDVTYDDTSLDGETHIPIGRPLPGYDVFVVDDSNNPVPVGWPGQIAVAGSAIGVGYLDNERLSQAKFVPSPMASTAPPARSRMYLTGDTGRMLQDGSVVVRGRLEGDSQLKLRGIRLELTDIEGSILAHAGGTLANAAVCARGGEGSDIFLVAYAVFATGKTPSNVSAYLAALLADLPVPAYMRPTQAVQLDQIPTTASGKVDRRKLTSLPLPRVPDLASSLDQVANRSMSPTEARLQRIWNRILGHTGIEVDRNSNFFAIGGNSLSLLSLQADIRKEFDTKIPLVELFNTKDLASLALHVQNAHERDSDTLGPAQNESDNARMDWSAETAVTADIEKGTFEGTASPKRGAMTVILTGSTGFLGSHLVRSLAAGCSIERICCLAVRDPNSSAARSLQAISSKVVLHQGDLSQANLGMSKDETQAVLEEADAIIHNGADVSFMKPYTALRAPNLVATKCLAEMALDRRVPFHYVSTAGVGILAGSDVVEEASLAAHPPLAPDIDGYICSKWASECYLENLHQATGAPVRIYRPSSITGEGAPALDIMHNMLRYSREMKVTPDLSKWRGAFDMIDVHQVARQIVGGVLGFAQGDERGKSLPLEFVHVSGEQVVPVRETRSFLERQMGCQMAEVEPKAWIERAAELGLHELVRSYMCELVESDNQPAFPRLRSRITFG